MLDRVVAVVNDGSSSTPKCSPPPKWRPAKPSPVSSRDSSEGQRRYDELRRRVLDTQIEKLLVAQYAREQKIYVTETKDAQRDQRRRQNNNLTDESQLRDAQRPGEPDVGLVTAACSVGSFSS